MTLFYAAVDPPPTPYPRPGHIAETSSTRSAGRRRRKSKRTLAPTKQTNNFMKKFYYQNPFQSFQVEVVFEI